MGADYPFTSPCFIRTSDRLVTIANSSLEITSLARAGVLPSANRALSLSFRISRYGVTRTSLGITIWQSQEGFPDMSRYSRLPLTRQRGKCYLPDKEFRYLRHFCYLLDRFDHRRLGRLYSAQLSMSPWRSDHIFTFYSRCLAYGL